MAPTRAPPRLPETILPDPEGRPTDIDRFVATHEATWTRLDALVRRAARRPEALSADEIDELVRLHLRVSSHLSTVRTRSVDRQLAGHLSQLVARSSAVVHGSRAPSWRTLALGVRDTFPAAVWHARRPIAVSTAVFVLALAVVSAWVATSPEVLDAFFPDPSQRQQLLEDDFEAYYSSEPGATFAVRVFTNNAGVAILAFGAGVLAAVPTLLVLLFNAVNVGVMAGLFHASGQAPHFWGLLLPHGLLELTGVFVAGGAGLRLGWAVLAPGDRTRRGAMAEEGRRAVVIVIGLVGLFAVAGLLEAFVTPAALPTSVRLGVGAAVWLTFVLYVVDRGRDAAAAGLTGALGEERGPLVRPGDSPEGEAPLAAAPTAASPPEPGAASAELTGPRSP